jgi:CheY-like chemotaxis protein/HPt (histidine-containing phosphotransfer) domain-containing protein
LIKTGSYDVTHDASTPATTADARATKGRLLIAEDNVINQRVAAGVLESLGYRCDLVSNGHEAVEAALRFPYDAILMDCQMPEMDGFAATAEIRRREGDTRHIPIIALTADVLEDARRKCLQAGMDAYVTKPLRREQLAAALERWVHKAPAAKSEPEAAVDAGDLIDQEQFAAVRAATQRGGPQVHDSLIELFLRDSELHIAELKRLLTLIDAAGIATCAHSLRGSAGNIGASKVMRLTGEIDQLAKENRIDAIRPLIPALEAVFERTKRAMTA